MKKFFEGLLGLAVLVGLISAAVWLWPSESAEQKQARERDKVVTFSLRAHKWKTDLDKAAAQGIGAVGSGNLDALSTARYAVGKLFTEVVDMPQSSPPWIAPCQHAALAALTALRSAQSGNMRETPDSFAVQSRRYLAATAACRQGIETAGLS